MDMYTNGFKDYDEYFFFFGGGRCNFFQRKPKSYLFPISLHFQNLIIIIVKILMNTI
jgi:hypothetical protein